MSRTKLDEAQISNTALVSERELGAGLLTEVVRSSLGVVDYNSGTGLITFTGAPLSPAEGYEVRAGQYVSLATGTGTLVCIIVSVPDFSIVEVTGLTSSGSGGTASIFEPPASTKVGIDTEGFQVLASHAKLQELLEQLDSVLRGLPSGGLTSQVLRKLSAADYDTAWSGVQEVPNSTTPGQVLTQQSSTPGDYDWSAPAVTPPGGSSTQVQYNNAGAFGGASLATVEDGAVVLKVPGSEPAPPASGVKIFGRSLAGRITPAWVGPSGLSTAVQSAIGRNKMGYWSSRGNSSAPLAKIGLPTPVITGTSTARNVGTASFYDALRRTAYLSAAKAGSSAGIRNGVRQWWRGDVSGAGGFHFIARFGFSDAEPVADARSFVGFVSITGVIPNADPSAQINILGVGNDSADTQLQFMYNDASGTATKAACGADFPADTSATDAYELILFAEPNGAEVMFMITNLRTGAAFSHTAVSDLPASTNLMAIQFWRNNGATALAVAIDVVQAYVETDY